MFNYNQFYNIDLDDKDNYNKQTEQKIHFLLQYRVHFQ